MSFLRKILDKFEPFFMKGGKLEKLYPLYEAGDTFLFTPKDQTKNAPFVRDNIDLTPISSSLPSRAAKAPN